MDGRGATILHATDRSVIPSVPSSTNLAGHAIRTADLGSLTLPTAAEHDRATFRVCPDLVDPLGPVQDVVLHEGAGTLRSTDGRPLGATVHVEEVRFGSIDGDAYEDALVRVRCTVGAATEEVAVLVRDTDRGPVVWQVLNPPTGTHRTTVTARPASAWAPRSPVVVTEDEVVDGVADPARRSVRQLTWSSDADRLLPT